MKHVVKNLIRALLLGACATMIASCSEITSDSGSDDAETAQLKFVLLSDKTFEVSAEDTFNLSELVIPSSYRRRSVTKIANYGFRDCSSLSLVTIPSSMTSIGRRAFYGCTSLTSVTIPSSVTFIDEEAFYGCSSLETIYCEASSMPRGWDSWWDAGTAAFDSTADVSVCWYSETEKPYCWHYVDGKPTRWLYQDGFVFSSLGESYAVSEYKGSSADVVIPSVFNGKPVTSIGFGAFSECTLKSVTIPSSVTSIEEYAFSWCFSLQSVLFEGGSKCASIGKEAFEYCSSLTSVTIPSSVMSIGEFAFSGCSSLESIYCEAVSKPSGWNSYWNESNATAYWYSKTNKSGCWHYVDGKPTLW